MKIKDIPWDTLDSAKKSLLQRLLTKTIEQPNECWLWTGAVNQSGQGWPHASIQTFAGLKQIGLNRVAWYIFHNMSLIGSKNIQVSRNTEVCDEKMCWNPDHLESVDVNYE